jgi:DNA-binding MarR family transcriptional regulator
MSDAADFLDALVRYEIGLWNALDVALRDVHQVTLGRFQALRALAVRGGRGRVQDLAGDLAITVGATSKLVDRLEQDGTAQREPNPDDRRSSLISLTAEGRRLYAAASTTFQAALRANLPAEAVDDLPVLTARLERMLGYVTTASAAGTAR